jgi:hypothetical protein
MTDVEESALLVAMAQFVCDQLNKEGLAASSVTVVVARADGIANSASHAAPDVSVFAERRRMAAALKLVAERFYRDTLAAEAAQGKPVGDA